MSFICTWSCATCTADRYNNKKILNSKVIAAYGKRMGIKPFHRPVLYFLTDPQENGGYAIDNINNRDFEFSDKSVWNEIKKIRNSKKTKDSVSANQNFETIVKDTELKKTLLTIKRDYSTLNEIEKIDTTRIEMNLDKWKELDEDEQQKIGEIIKSTSHNELVEKLYELIALQESVKVFVNTESFKRYNAIIRFIKQLRGTKCELPGCGISIVKKDDTEYIEAAHIDPKSEGGKEIPENIILLCPNHHKEFDLGNREIIRRSESFIEFKINGKGPYFVNLSVS